jgi:hypothetical protein
MPEPVITGSGEPVISGGAQLLVLAAAHQIDCLGKVLGDVELIKYDLARASSRWLRVELIYGSHMSDLLPVFRPR